MQGWHKNWWVAVLVGIMLMLVSIVLNVASFLTRPTAPLPPPAPIATVTIQETNDWRAQIVDYPDNVRCYVYRHGSGVAMQCRFTDRRP
jgi:hypothetical protein